MNYYQVRLTMSKKGYKNRVLTGVVLAKSQAEAVLEAKTLIKEKSDSSIDFKLLGASPIKSDFVIIQKT